MHNVGEGEGKVVVMIGRCPVMHSSIISHLCTSSDPKGRQARSVILVHKVGPNNMKVCLQGMVK